MQAKVDIDNDVSIVSLSGYLDFETVIPFKRDCLDSINTPKVIFDFEHLNFVGSCGLTSFLQSLLTFSETLSRRPRYVRAGVEFRRLMQTIEFLEMDFFDSTQLAKESFIYSDAGTYALDSELRSVSGETLFHDTNSQGDTSVDSVVASEFSGSDTSDKTK